MKWGLGGCRAPVRAQGSGEALDTRAVVLLADTNRSDEEREAGSAVLVHPGLALSGWDTMHPWHGDLGWYSTGREEWELKEDRWVVRLALEKGVSV